MSRHNRGRLAEQGLSTVIFVDADNTLWDTNQVFAQAQLELLRRVEQAVGHTIHKVNRLAFVRAFDQALAEKHHAHLRYPPRLLVKAIALTLTGWPRTQAIRIARSGRVPELTESIVVKIESNFVERLRVLPRLRRGVSKGLCRLKAMGCRVIVLTESNRKRTAEIIAKQGLATFVDRVVETKKSRSALQRISRFYRAENAFLVGDQLDRDIRSARDAGLRTIYFPGGFRPKWEPSETKVKPDYRIDRFDQVAGILADK